MLYISDTLYISELMSQHLARVKTIKELHTKLARMTNTLRCMIK